jgi:hypothetical protein
MQRGATNRQAWVAIVALIAVMAAGLTAAEAAAEEQAVSANITAELDPFEGTSIEMLTPVGVKCKVMANKKSREFTVPFQFPAQAGIEYDFECALKSGTPWRWKTSPKVSQAVKIRVEERVSAAVDPFGGQGEDVPPGHHDRHGKHDKHDRHDRHDGTGPDGAPTPPLPPPPAAPQPMAAQDFTAFLATIESASFSSDKINAVKTAVKMNHFTIDQVGAVLKKMSFASEFSDALNLMAPKVIDPQNAFKLHKLVSFSSQTDEINKAFGQ